MKELMSWLGATSSHATGKPFTICHKWNLLNGTTDFTLSIPVGASEGSMPPNFVAGRIPACGVYQVKHTGPYRFLDNAWASGLMGGKAKFFRANCKIDAFEIYENDPKGTDDSDLVTLVNFPVK